jgi:hypothetical protein
MRNKNKAKGHFDFKLLKGSVSNNYQTKNTPPARHLPNKR